VGLRVALLASSLAMLLQVAGWNVKVLQFEAMSVREEQVSGRGQSMVTVCLLMRQFVANAY
jgi:hypothetical protein